MADNMLRERMNMAQPAGTPQGSNALRSLLGFLSDSQSWKDMGRNALNMIGSPLPTRQEEMANALRRRLQGSVMRDYPGAETDAANAYREKMTNLAMGMNPVLATVWHGSPHKFDAFDMSKIGTGEGAQAYGHGLYFAESPKVAKSYADGLAVGKYDGATYNPSNPAHIAADYAGGQSRKEAVAAIDRKLAALKDSPEADVFKQARQLILENREAKYSATPTPNLYKVDLPDDQIARMLDWDKPLNKQPKDVRNALRAADLVDAKTGKMYPGSDLGGTAGGNMTGSEGAELVRSLARQWENSYGPDELINIQAKNGQEAASKYLQSIGIPGIRYLDGGSRGAGQGTSNFVVFDDRIPKILGRE